jgi:tetratricopeptide (TPR) repeat protein
VLSWTLQVAGRAETALRIGVALVFFWWMRGYLSEGRSWLERALASSVPSRPILAKALVAAGRLALLQRDVEPARAYFEQGLILFQEARDIWGTAWALTGLAEIESDTERKRALAEKSLAQFRSTGDHWGIGFALYTLAELARLSGEDTRAATLFEESAAMFRAAGDQRGIGFVLLSLGRTWLHVGDHVRAASVLAESLALLAGVEDRGTGMAAVLQGLGSLAHERGDQERAAKLYGAAEALHEAAGTRRLIDHEDWKRSVTRMPERLGDDKFMAAWGDGRAMTLEQAIAYALEGAGEANQTDRFQPTPRGDRR